MQIDRRSFLSAAGSIAASSLMAPRASSMIRSLSGVGTDKQERTLVLIQLAGGNDGLSTVVPYSDPGYASVRPTLRWRKEDLLLIDEECGMHPALKGLKSLYDRGELAIVEGTGYPDAIRSHFRSFEVWHAAAYAGRGVGEGWVPRLLREAFPGEMAPERITHIGKRAPYSLHSDLSSPVAFEVPESYRWFGGGAERGPVARESRTGNPVLDRLRDVKADARASNGRIRDAASRYRTTTQYPNTGFGRALRVAASLIDARLKSRVISIELAGFDTHRSQRGTHSPLMRVLGEGLTAFTDDLRGRSVEKDTLIVVFSEFGRRVAENGGKGTDHGQAGPMFVLGSPVRGGFHGQRPRLDELRTGDLAFTTDFRSVYGTVCERWFGADQEAVLGARYPLLDLV